MTDRFPDDVDDLIKKQLATGHYASADEVLRDALHALDSQIDDWKAIEAGLKTLDDGVRGISLDGAFRLVRKRNNVA